MDAFERGGVAGFGGFQQGLRLLTVVFEIGRHTTPFPNRPPSAKRAERRFVKLKIA